MPPRSQVGDSQHRHGRNRLACGLRSVDFSGAKHLPAASSQRLSGSQDSCERIPYSRPSSLTLTCQPPSRRLVHTSRPDRLVCKFRPLARNHASLDTLELCSAGPRFPEALAVDPLSLTTLCTYMHLSSLGVVRRQTVPRLPSVGLITHSVHARHTPHFRRCGRLVVAQWLGPWPDLEWGRTREYGLVIAHFPSPASAPT